MFWFLVLIVGVPLILSAGILSLVLLIVVSRELSMSITQVMYYLVSALILLSSIFYYKEKKQLTG